MFTFDVAYFRELFPEFGDDTKYPDARLSLNWDIATCFISPVDYGWLHGNARKNALYYMTAHITSFGSQTENGQIPVFATNATIAMITTGVLAPPVRSQFQYTLNTTAYGQLVLSLLSVATVGGMYVGGSNDKNLFRTGGGWLSR